MSGDRGRDVDDTTTLSNGPRRMAQGSEWPKRLMSKIRSRAAPSAPETGPITSAPALFARISKPENSVAAASRRRSTAPGSAMSACTASASPPSSVIEATVSSAPARLKPYPTTMEAPSAAKRCAVERPIPREPPVMIATLLSYPFSEMAPEATAR